MDTTGAGSAPGDPGSFALVETMRLEDGAVSRLDRHLARMAASAERLGFAWSEPRVRGALDEARGAHPDGCWRLRLLLSRDGTPAIDCTPFDAGPPRPWRVACAAEPIGEDAFRRNKTTRRAVYDAARHSRPDVDDVLLWNSRGEVTESTIANLVVEIDGVRVTPPVSCGLLPGVLRGELVDDGTVREQVLRREDVARASRIWLVNSLRGWIDAVLVD